MQAINSNTGQNYIDKLFNEYEYLKMMVHFEDTKENKEKLKEIKQKLIDLGFEEEVKE